jgi:predicted ATP-binding protein involved in virulence
MKTKLTKLILNHVGGFKKFEINFHEKLTILIGKNGSGKTTVLSSIAAMFDIALDALLKSDNKKNDHIIVNKFLTTYRNNKLLFDASKDYYMHIDANINNIPKKVEIILNSSINYEDFSNALINLYNKKIPLPVFTYYATYNAPLHDVDFSDLRQDKHPLSFYIAACREESFDFNRFFNWFRWQENLNKEVGSKHYKIVRQAITDILTDSETIYGKPYITWQRKYNGDLCIDKNGIPLDMNQLSAGEKVLFILVADLARRLTLANSESYNPLHGDGIVLIDKIDLHLHPSWQRNIIPKLIKMFPNCQFIITTHSPSILADVKPENIIILEHFQAVQNTQHSLGRDTNAILSDIMGDLDRPEKVQKKIKQCFQTIDAGKFMEAQELVVKLEKDLGSNDPDIVYIHSLLEFYKE